MTLKPFFLIAFIQQVLETEEYLLIEITFSFNVLQCPDSACKQDLLAYLQRIALYCHQLNICSKVKAEVQNLGGELIVSGVSRELGFTIKVPTVVLPRQAFLATVLLKTPNYSDSQGGVFFFFNKCYHHYSRPYNNSQRAI